MVGRAIGPGLEAAGLRTALRALGIDQLGAAGEIAPIDQTLDRNLLEIGVGEIAVAIGEGEFARFGNQMDGLERVGLQRTQIESFEDRQRLQDRHAARGRRAHAANPVGAIGAAHRLPLDRLVVLQVLLAQRARFAGLARRPDHRAADTAVVEGLRAAIGDNAERFGQFGIGQPRARRFGIALGIEKIRPRRGEVLELGRIGDQPMQARGNLESVERQTHRGLEQARPGQAAVIVVREFEHAQHTRDADRVAAQRRLGESERLAFAVQEHVGLGAGRRGLAPVIGFDLLGLGLVVQQEPAAADTRALRLDQREHHLHGDRRVHGRTALAQYQPPDIRGDRIGRDDHLALGAGHGAGGGDRRRAFGLGA